ncbi:hypothetical protein [Agrobacterium tumefaciens]|uniref:hypothetical protein n=1 Tax=Agrobacterium tumefaciens TaxID=358 RepID=UPI001476B669|nr:hypothetical protein [Agrobacterium tumefaciens]
MTEKYSISRQKAEIAFGHIQACEGIIGSYRRNIRSPCQTRPRALIDIRAVIVLRTRPALTT